MTKSPAYAPLDGLLDLACRDGIEIRPTLLRVLTDLYVQKPTHSVEEETQYVELALGLIEAVDAPTRAAVAATLATYPAAPATILRKLTGTEAAFGSDISTLTETEAVDLLDLFFAATVEKRRLILGSLDVAAAPPTQRPAPSSSEVHHRLEAAALQHNAGEFSRMLKHALGISQALAERITRDQFGEPIVVAARALGMKAAALQRILLFLNPLIGQSVERVHDLARLFDELPTQVANHMAAIWRKAGGQSRPVYEPVLSDDERRGTRSLATPTQHRVARDRDELLSRIKNSTR